VAESEDGGFSEADVGSIDYELLRHGATALFHRPALFNAVVDELAVLGYLVHRIDARALAPFVADLTEALRFQENFGYSPWGGKLDALDDAFCEVRFGDHRAVAFAFNGFDALHRVEPYMAQCTLDMFEANARDHMLFGHRLLAVVQSDDPDLKLGSLGARAATWNRQEDYADRHD
jgi:hypothetical protein